MSFRFKAGCLAVGSELLGEKKLDLNSLEITAKLQKYGFDMIEKRIIGDDAERIAAAIRDLLVSCEIVVVTGGLGPTADDVTRRGVAEALGRELLHDEDIETWLEERYRSLGRPMPEICRVMADVVEGARVLKNHRGSAPGILVETDGRLLAVFPGVPWEMREMLEHELLPELKKRSGGKQRMSRTLLLCGPTESEAESRIRHLYENYGRENITILASFGIVRLVLTSEGRGNEGIEKLNEMEAAFRKHLGADVAGVDVNSPAEVCVRLLSDRQESLATAESCTGGMIGKELTSVPGASLVYPGGIISYSNEVKEALLQVPQEMLGKFGAVSAPVARTMAEGARQRLGCTWGLGVTGIAGPDGGSEEKPVGLVHWAVAGPEGTINQHRVFPGDREIIRQWSSNAVLDLLRRQLIPEVGGAVDPSLESK